MAVLMVLTITGCETADDKQNEVIEQKPLVVVVTDEGGIGDYSFNDSVLEALEEAKKDYDVDIRCVEAEPNNPYAEHIQNAVYEDAEIVIAAGSHMGDAVKKVAKENPDHVFGIVDSYITGDNVFSISYADNESGFLAGYAAGKQTKTNKVGLVGGEQRKTVDVYRYGFEAGLKMANPKAELVIEYAGSFLDENEGYNVAEAMIKDQKVDVIFHVAGASGKGVIDACKDNGVWAIGSDKDQSKLASKNVLCSAVKDMEDGISEMIEMAMEDKFQGGHKMFGIYEEGVELSDDAGNLPDALDEELEDLEEKIENMDIEVPDDEATMDYFLSHLEN